MVVPVLYAESGSIDKGANNYSIKPDSAYKTGTTNQKTANVTRK